MRFNLNTPTLILTASNVMLCCNAFFVTPAQKVSTFLKMGSESSSEKISSRRLLIKEAFCVLATSTVIPPQAAQATVFLDPDRYGDKELKIATVNKLRQNIRSILLNKPKLASQFVEIAMLDALTFDAKTGEGGPDGTILGSILSGSSTSPLASLKPAAGELAELAKNIKKTTEITLADVVAFSGAEAIETSGGPRIVVQLGKLDPKKPPQKRNDADLNTGKSIVDAFLKAGLTEREVALMYGAMGSIDNVVANIKVVDQEVEEENEMGDTDVFVPTSFGAPKEIYGKRLGTMDNSFFNSVAADIKKGRPLESFAFSDDKVGSWATKYSGKQTGFVKDLPEAYEKLMSLGATYTGGKMANILSKES